MNVWINDSIIKSALAEEPDASGGGRAAKHFALARSESNLSSKSSFDHGGGGPSSSRHEKWVWVESAVLSGSAQSLFCGLPRVGNDGGSPNRRISLTAQPLHGIRPAASSPRSAANDNEEALTVRVTDPESEHEGAVVTIASRHLATVAGGRGILPANRAAGAGGGADSPLDRPSDLTHLAHLNEPCVVACLQRRFGLRTGWEMYTSSGPILIAINPCRTVQGLYGDDAMRMYWRWGERFANGAPSSTPSSPGGIREVTGGAGGVADDRTPPPHVFGVADSAYRGMMRGLDFVRSSLGEEKKEEAYSGFFANQSVLVSGESGAGKTVTTKFIMQYLAALSKKVDAGHAASGSSEKSSIEQRVLQSNYILEAFGNARTLRNDNSSRFGKFIELRFTDRGRLAGASIDTYLLEKARIIGHTCGERTYHIFYMVCKALSSSERKRFYVNNSAASDFVVTTSDGGRDRSRLLHNGYDDHAAMFGELRAAMNTMGFSRGEQAAIFQAVCGLLHLSNLTRRGAFVEINDGEECVLNKKDTSLDPSLQLLGVSYEALNAAVTTVRFKAVGEMVKKNLNVDQAVRAVQALIKGAYDSIFSLLVKRINMCIVGSSPGEENISEEGAFIGLLDIFGFESFETNSFEQLCINYCNESLQQQFNRFVFKLEQQEYKREGIKWDMIEFEDNQNILDLIERKQGGIFPILDEQCKLGMRCTDKTFVSAVYAKCMSVCDRFSANKAQKSQGKFSIHHYAGIVEYDTAGFMEKNKDEIPMEASELFSNSSCKFVQDVAREISSKIGSGNKQCKRPTVKSSISRLSVGGQFSSQLQTLRRRIDDTHPHYVRCLKPNDQLQPGRFDPNTVVDQLRCGGILEAIRVSRAGFPHRYAFDHFESRFRILSSALSPAGEAKQRPPRRVGRLNLRSHGPPAKRKAVASRRKQHTDPKKRCEVLVKVIAEWILKEREKSAELQKPQVDKLVPAALSPRSFWKNQSPKRPQNTLIHKTLDTSEAGIQLGMTKVFLLQDTFDCIERARGQVLATSATKITSMARMRLARRTYLAILRSHRDSFGHMDRGYSDLPTRMLEAKSEDSSVLRQVDVNLEMFESKSSFERANSFAKSEPQEYEWVSIGHGRFVRRESSMTMSGEMNSVVSHEFSTDCDF